MKCPYKYKTDCKQVNTSGMDMVLPCEECDWYNNGVRETGAVNKGCVWVLLICLSILFWVFLFKFIF